MKHIRAYTATWCGPCKMIKRELAKIEQETDILIKYYDIDELKDEIQSLGIKSVPTLLYMEDETELNRTSGFIPAKNILEKLEG